MKTKTPNLNEVAALIARMDCPKGINLDGPTVKAVLANYSILHNELSVADSANLHAAIVSRAGKK